MALDDYTMVEIDGLVDTDCCHLVRVWQQESIIMLCGMIQPPIKVIRSGKANPTVSELICPTCRARATV